MAKRSSATTLRAASARSGGLQAVARTVNPVTREQIAARAYEIYTRRCHARQSGDAVSDWLTAETELRSGNGT